MNDRVMKPWTPVTVTEEENSVSVGVLGRKNTSGCFSFLESMVSQGFELLASPIRLVGKEDGKDFAFTNYSTFTMEKTSDAKAVVLSSAESEEFIANISMTTEFDGFIDLSLTVAPRGRTVKQIFGLQGLDAFRYELTRLWLEIPIKKECAKYYQMFPTPVGMSALDASGEVREKLQLPFKSQIMLANDDAGFMISFESRKNFAPLDNEQAFEIIPSEDETLLRIRLFDEEPLEWQKTDKTNPKERTSLHPISFHFGIITTPVKPITANITDEKAVHIDCFKKIPENYEDFLGSEFEDTGEIVFDRLKRLGVNTLYIHEKWNDLQNSPILTTKTSKRLRYIIDECHKRKIKVIPYFGYEISSLAPYFSELLPEVEVLHDRVARWYRQPPQRDSKACQKSRWSEFFTDGIEKLIEKYGFDGIYLDGTAYTWPCTNTSHGCGCYSPSGDIYPTYPFFATRKTMKRLYEIIVEKHGGIINCHAGSAFNMPALSFATSMWDGESFQQGFIDGSVEKLPDDYFKCLYTGKNLGLLIYMLCYLTPPVWTMDMALALSLPFGILPKVNDVGEPLEIISKIWRIYDSFGISESQFIPFHAKSNTGITVSDEKVKVSLYEKEDCALAIIATTDKTLSLEFDLNSRFSTVINEMTGEIVSNDGTAKLKLSGFDYLILKLK